MELAVELWGGETLSYDGRGNIEIQATDYSVDHHRLQSRGRSFQSLASWWLY